MWYVVWRINFCPNIHTQPPNHTTCVRLTVGVVVVVVVVGGGVVVG